MELPEITKKQLEILISIYKFRFLNTNQIQALLNHKHPQKIRVWLKDLREKGYVVYRDFDRLKFGNNTKPAIYSLTKLARKKLKDHEKCEVSVLNRVYQEKEVSAEFVNRYTFLAQFYIKLLSQVGKENLKYFTQYQLQKYDYFPQPLPDAYITIKGTKSPKRYFLYLLDERTPWLVLRTKIKRLISYTNDDLWSESTNESLPSFLLIFPNERIKRIISKFISEELHKGSFYVGYKDKIKESEYSSDLWEKIE